MITTESPPPPQQVTETIRFVGYENDTFQKAFSWAVEEYVRKYPGARVAITGLQSFIQQYLNAHHSRS